MVASVTVLDSTGATQTVNTLPPLGTAVSAAALPVVLASDSGNVPVVGPIAAGTATNTDSPIKVGGNVSTTLPGLRATGVRQDSWLGAAGNLIVGFGLSAPIIGASGGSQWPVDATGTARALGVISHIYNGASSDAQRKTNIYSRVSSSAAAGNPAVLKASAGDLKQFWGLNTTAAIVYLNIYNKATAPVLGTDTPIESYPIPASAQFSVMMADSGDYFSTGISYAFSTDSATIPTTGTAAAAITSFVIKGA